MRALPRPSSIVVRAVGGVFLAIAIAPATAAHDEDLVPLPMTALQPAAVTAAQLSQIGRGHTHSIDPETEGAWSPLIFFPKLSPNAALLPTGKVLFFGKRADLFSALFDPETLTITEIPLPGSWNPTCTGHMMLPDGRLVAFGGIHKAVSNVAHREVYAFDPFVEEWEQQADMNQGRFYPSGELLADGRMVFMGGSSDVIGHGKRNLDIEVFDPLSRQGTIELVEQRELDWYPLLHLMPTGEVFLSGPSASTELLDSTDFTWTPVAQRNVSTRFYAPSVLLPPNNRRVMIFGGAVGSQTGGGFTTATNEVIDLAAPTPTWEFTSPLNFKRTDHSAVILPNQLVFIVGGRATTTGAPTQVPIFVPELYDPAKDRFTPVSPHKHPRLQHSTALLLPDARVLVAGKPEVQSAEIFSPPYLLNGTERPEVLNAPEDLTYGSSFQLELSSPTQVNQVCLMRYHSVTHSVSFGQRYVDLGQHALAGASGGSGTVTVDAPTNTAAAPPGFYMLFVVSAEGTPSVAATIQLR